MVITVKVNHEVVLVTGNRELADEFALETLKYDREAVVDIITEERIRA